ncbi:DNA replication endonuclease-helicase Dna2 [Sporothrix bragantina]|uniref:DNA replication ATP-dependent helicase/nuclease DNA2 n=1 Tax=Sporothrix bragantina TaxID=671064 RepID=A0ABP0C102_9PEZI
MNRQQYRYNGHRPWNRPLTHAPRPPHPPLLPPPPPPPPIEISETTKSKLKKFHFRPPRSKRIKTDAAVPLGGPVKSVKTAEDTKVVEAAVEEAIDKTATMAAPDAASKQIGSQRGSQKKNERDSQSRQTSQRAGTKTDSTQPDKPATAPTASNDSDKENNTNADDTSNALPSTQPSKITPTVVATPEFLSIHVRTPRARFAWQDLAGTPDTPKIKETLGISPNAKLSWGTGQAGATSPPLPSKQGTKRPRSTSPPSSPTNPRSKRVAENVQKFKEVMASATMANMALDARAPRRRNALTRHRTEVGRPTVRSDAANAVGVLGIEQSPKSNSPAAPNGPSPRNAPGFRRSMSCNTLLTPTSKRQKTGILESDHRQGHNMTPVSKPQQTTLEPERQPSIQRESRPLDGQRPPPLSNNLEAPAGLEEADQVDQIETAPPVRPISPVAIHRLSLTTKDDASKCNTSIPDIESNGPDPKRSREQLQPSTVDKPANTDIMSDYGDDDVFDEFDDFDDDMLAEIDASLAPTRVHTVAPDVDPILAVVDTNTAMSEPATRDEFDDLDDGLDDMVADDLLTAIETNVSRQANPATRTPRAAKATSKIKPASNVKPGCEVGDMEDMYGGDDDFGDDFDFEAAELAATQAVGRAAATISAAAPWANTQKSSQKRRAIQRYLVTNVLISSYHDDRQSLCQEKILVVQADGEKKDSGRAVHLRGDWFNTSASIKAYIHVLGEFDSSGMCVIDDDHGMLILHPDQLLSSTVVAESFSCTRRAVLQDRVKETGTVGPPLVYGTLVHEIFQDALLANEWSHDFLSTAADNTIQKHLEELYTIKVDVPTAREYLLTRTRELASWADLFVNPKPKPGAMAEGRNGEKVNMSISKLLDIEEHVWSPMYGLKGNIDATIQVVMNTEQDSKTLTMPFELKTGKRTSITHQAQTIMYNLLLSDRYDIEIVYGILYYTEHSQMLRIPAVRNELRHMIMKRNELACYVRERSVQLPPMLRNRSTCGWCFAKTSCFVYHKLADDGTGETSGMGDKFTEVVGHLTPMHKEFFLKWEDLLTKEEKVGHKLRRELWTMLSAEREKVGRCFGNVIIEEGSAYEEQSTTKINRFRYTFVKENPAPGFSFMDSQLVVGDPIVISDEDGHFGLAIGFVSAIRKQRMDVAVDRRLHNARIRQPGFDEKTSQVFAGIMEAGKSKKHFGIKENYGGRSQTKHSSNNGNGNSHIVRYRIDKDEFTNGMATIRNNIVQVMAGHRTDARELRQLVVDLVPPRFKAKTTQYALDDAEMESLNVDQKQAIAKVMSAEDYALVLGMPGTGKTTTIAHIIRALVSQNKSVLLTSYTHTAVDNILLKLRTPKTPILRLGVPAKVHPEVREFAILAGEPKSSLEEIRSAWHETPIVATTCLGVNHPIFNERTFDYCIVDEASQITLPICLGPIRMARTFVLVGDHNQLPPLVQSDDAREGGLDVSLFKLLSDTHPDSVVNLEHQYRMCEDIMALSNTLIYSGRLKCGTEALRHRSLHVPDMARLHLHHHNASSMARLTPTSFCAMGSKSCWLRDLLRPETRVAFVNTDAIPSSREEAKGNRTVNPCEARLVAQLVEGLLTVGVPASDIGVMTHYRSQLSLLRNSLRGVNGASSSSSNGNNGSGASAIEMHTADRFQGRDKEVVVLSLVRNNEACLIGDLLKDWRRINVAFTRAKTKLLVVGSRSTLKGGVNNTNKDTNNKKSGGRGDRHSLNGETGEEMLARFINLMEARSWIYDLPSDALENHLFEELPATQAGSLAMSMGLPVTGPAARPSPGKSVDIEDTFSGKTAISTSKSTAPLRQIAAPNNRSASTTLQNGSSRKPRLLVALSTGKENQQQRAALQQPGKRVGLNAEAIIKKRPVLRNLLNDMIGGDNFAE